MTEDGLMDNGSRRPGQTGDPRQVTRVSPGLMSRPDRSKTEHPEQCGDVFEPVRHDQEHPITGHDPDLGQQ